MYLPKDVLVRFVSPGQTRNCTTRPARSSRPSQKGGWRQRLSRWATKFREEPHHSRSLFQSPDTLPLGGSESQLRGGRPWQCDMYLPKDVLVRFVSPGQTRNCTTRPARSSRPSQKGGWRQRLSRWATKFREEPHHSRSLFQSPDTLPLGGSESQLRGGRPWQCDMYLPKDVLVRFVSPGQTRNCTTRPARSSRPSQKGGWRQRLSRWATKFREEPHHSRSLFQSPTAIHPGFRTLHRSRSPFQPAFGQPQRTAVRRME